MKTRSNAQTLNSRVDNRNIISETQWLISVINQRQENTIDRTTSLLFGHARIIIEGMRDGVVFVGDYDIEVDFDEPSNAVSSFFSWFDINRTGRVSKIRAYEDGYSNPGGVHYYEESQSKSYPVLRQNAELVIDSIKEDMERTKQAVKAEKKIRGSGDFIKFQQLGSEGGPIQALLSDSNGGLNCAEWCIQKLRVAGINASGKPKPELVAGGCVIS